MNFGISRRALLCAFPLGLGAQVTQPFRKTRPLPSVGEFTRVVDPVTENIIVRLTFPTSTSILPYPRNHYVSARDRVLVFSSDRAGKFAPFQMDLRTGVLRQLAECSKLNPRSPAFDRQEKLVRYLDGDSLFEVSAAHGSPRRLADSLSSFAGAPDGSLYLIAAGKLIRKFGNDSRPLTESATEVWPQPNSAGCVFSRSTGPDERELFYVPADGSAQPTLLAKGNVREPWWDADGQSILFLRDVTTANGTVVAEIRGKPITESPEYVVSPTSQFASFAPNNNASVFVGASRSRAQPNVIIMLRSPHREMTLCEHRSSHPGEVSPIFSPDNRRIYFESDHEGRSAIYSVNVELLVESE